MNPALARLQVYPFERLAALLAGASPPSSLPHIAMSIGEPKHQPPAFVLEALASNLHRLDSYPATRGLPVLRESIAAMLQRRMLPAGAVINAETQILPVNGTREALFAFAQAAIAPHPDAVVVMPNPCYQIYEGAAILAGATPYYVDTTAATRFIPDLSSVPVSIWKRCQVLFLCSPGNPTGASLSVEYLQHALELAERHDFVVAADECYAELYLDEAQPPPSLLRAACESGRAGFERCVVFHSLSKRSSVPGLRSGFVAGNATLMKQYLLYRTYHGCAMPVPTQLASAAAWADDAHVTTNRALYREKFQRVLPLLAPVLEVVRPDGGFYLWPQVGDDVAFTRQLHEQQNLTILPGSFLAREHHGFNPGTGRVRISLVASVAECVSAAERIRTFLANRPNQQRDLNAPTTVRN
jgi:N-succinyldiaminopimelate aminotransferase